MCLLVPLLQLGADVLHNQIDGDGVVRSTWNDDVSVLLSLEKKHKALTSERKREDTTEEGEKYRQNVRLKCGFDKLLVLVENTVQVPSALVYVSQYCAR
jgi:hypothetical protein